MTPAVGIVCVIRAFKCFFVHCVFQISPKGEKYHQIFSQGTLYIYIIKLPDVYPGGWGGRRAKLQARNLFAASTFSGASAYPRRAW